MIHPALRSNEVSADPLIEALERVRPRLKRVFRHFRLSIEDAEDVLQDLSLLAVQKAPQIENLDVWLVGSAHNLCMGLLDKNRRRARHHVSTATEGIVAPSQEHLGFRVDLKRVLPLLPAKPRQAVVLHAMGFGPREIAFQTGYSPASVRQILVRGLAYLRLRLGGPGRSGPPIGDEPRSSDSPALSPPSPPSPAMLLPLAVRSWVNPKTRKTYVRRLRAFARWLGYDAGDSAAAIAELLSAGASGAQEIVSRYRAALLARGCASGTVKLYLAPLSGVLRLAREHGLIDWRLEAENTARASGRADSAES